MKKITYFLDYVRNKFYLKTNKLDKEFIERLSEKSGKPVEEIKNLMSFIEKINHQTSISENELMKLNRDLEKFYN
jgi:predicted house-cleaning noncanonical NTP pyrophosphatase (MazG superfamily)